MKYILIVKAEFEFEIDFAIIVYNLYIFCGKPLITKASDIDISSKIAEEKKGRHFGSTDLPRVRLIILEAFLAAGDTNVLHHQATRQPRAHLNVSFSHRTFRLFYDFLSVPKINFDFIFPSRIIRRNRVFFSRSRFLKASYLR